MTVGERLRTVRTSRGLSLQSIANQAHMSVATLSRIETNKQGVEMETFLDLARILDCRPYELLDPPQKEADSVGPLIRGIAVLSASERTRLWRKLATESRSQSSRGRRAQIRHLAQQVEELLAQLDFLYAEIEAVRKRLGRK
jgi:transcriptional regulator with XRE-family HTH domain